MSPAAPAEVTIELALCQINPVVGDLAGNAELAIERIGAARDLGAQLVVFPELALSGYPPEDLVLREDFLAAAQRQLERVAAAAKGAVVLIGYPSAGRDGVANSVALLSAGRVVLRYDKQLLPNYGVFDERRYFMPGSTLALADCDGVAIGLSICEDAWFDAPVIDGLAGAGARMVINCSASPYHAGKTAEREKMLSARASRHTLPIAYCNLVGGQDELVFDGASVVIGADGGVIARGPQFETELLRCSLTFPPLSDDKAVSSAPADRVSVALPKGSGAAGRPIAVALRPREREVYRALQLGTADYLRKNGFPDALVGVSGGIDSAVVLAIACDAIGADNVTGVTMPSPYTSDATLADSHSLMRNLGCAALEYSIESVMDEFTAILARTFETSDSDHTEENIQARIRGTLLMALSNKFGSLVLTTGNKSEMAVGYTTLYGDMAGGFAVLKDVPKKLVFALARWRNQCLPDPAATPEPIPPAILDRPPSAELRAGQTDEATLGSYAVLDEIIERYIELDQSLDEIVAAGADREFASKILRMIDLAEYKRRQAPPGIKITPRAFGRDRRMPITARRRYE
ncbi:MAG: NAD+ synthase [Solirubrobacterales bacterium]